jgi:hypothetical protein
VRQLFEIALGLQYIGHKAAFVPMNLPTISWRIREVSVPEVRDRDFEFRPGVGVVTRAKILTSLATTKSWSIGAELQRASQSPGRLTIFQLAAATAQRQIVRQLDHSEISGDDAVVFRKTYSELAV